ncbi:PRC-barrel domain-containing protein [Methanobacterium sp. SMA-27]|uniref:PRC-barrel domain-containing protein n=1 Tax=Methanobacterium sp. SMA-27 TaxID=1495336 RepID=UPI00064F5086|nr:PRC-barrel domain-containing protein [Methanobacterium sp. SMA-27]
MLIKKEIIGKEVVDTAGIVIGKVQDVEVDFETQTLESFKVGKGGILESLGSSSGGTIIPYDIVKIIGDKVLLTSDIHEQ